MSRLNWFAFALALIAVCRTTQAADNIVRVFVLAGQSNMEGKAPNKLLDYQATQSNDEKTRDFFTRFRDGDHWTERDDVFIKFLNRKGKLTIGYGSPNRTGLELAFGHKLGDRYDEPVLLIKTAWGGRSLCKDFRPPSAGWPSDEFLADELAKAIKRTVNDNAKRNRDDPLPTLEDIKADYGKDYRAMMSEVRDTLKNIDSLFPELAGKTPIVTGFVWFQGWNDQYGGQDEYAANMECFIRDVRRDLDVPKLPFVIGVMGQNGSSPAKGAMQIIQTAQLAMPDQPDFVGNVSAIGTDELVDKVAEKLVVDWQDHVEEWEKVGGDGGYHYLGSAIWFCRIGEAMGDAMIDLVLNQQ